MDKAFEEAFNLLCGKKIGSGMSRTVFECTLLPDCVVKVETDPQMFQNIIEWETWHTVKNMNAAKWFAECGWISPNGRILIQERTRPPAPNEFLLEIPIWFTDTKKSNWGMANTNSGDKQVLVCHDYGTSLMLQKGTTTKRLKKADWFD